jgi:hypothetical protein
MITYIIKYIAYEITKIIIKKNFDKLLYRYNIKLY